VWISFFKTLAKLASGSIISLAKSENNRPKIWKRSVRGKKQLARLTSEFVFLLAKPAFYLHLVSWRVVIRSPGYCSYQAMAIVLLPLHEAENNLMLTFWFSSNVQ
jgi:hypothetical protein